MRGRGRWHSSLSEGNHVMIIYVIPRPTTLERPASIASICNAGSSRNNYEFLEPKVYSCPSHVVLTRLSCEKLTRVPYLPLGPWCTDTAVRFLYRYVKGRFDIIYVRESAGRRGCGANTPKAVCLLLSNPQGNLCLCQVSQFNLNILLYLVRRKRSIQSPLVLPRRCLLHA